MMNIYQVLPRLFGNTNATNQANGTLAENGCGKLNDFTSPVLAAIEKMGYTHIWYTGVIEHASKTSYKEFKIADDHPGVVKGQAGSPYAIKDYYDIAPDLAVDVPNRMKEFEALVTRTHKAGLKVIIDFVPNHVARQYKSDAKPAKVKDLGASDHTDWGFSPQNNFYYMPYQDLSPQFDVQGYTEFPAKATGNDQFSAFPQINDWYETVKLNYGVDYQAGRIEHFDPIPDTWHKMRDILLFWAKKKVDGFRCDMAEMVPVAFWGWVIPQVKAINPNIIFIAEVYNPAEYRNYIHNGRFDYLYDKVGLYDTLRSITCNDGKWAADITACWQSVNDILPHMLHFMENHDEQRIASDFFAGKGELAIPAMIVSGALHAAPLMVYFGQELGEPGMEAEGFSGLDGRTTIFDYWSMSRFRTWLAGGFQDKALTVEQKALKNTYQKLLHLRKAEKTLSMGSSYDLMYANFENNQFNPQKHFACFRNYENELLLVVVNFDEKAWKIGLQIPEHAFEFLHIDAIEKVNCVDLLSGKKFSQALKPTNKFQVDIPAHQGLILKIS